MAIPEPTINIDDLLVGSSNPALDVGVREGSMIGLIERPQIASPYGPDNLPEFMRGFEQVTPTTFAPVIGGLTTAGLTPEEILLQQQREQEFRESFAIDPTMYGAQYQPALFSVLDKPFEAPAPEDDALTDLIATYVGVQNFLPEVDLPDISLPDMGGTDGSGLDSIVDPIGEAARDITQPIGEGLKKAGEFIGEEVIDPIADTAETAVKAAGEFIGDKIVDPAVDIVKSLTPDIDLPDIDLPDIDLPDIDLSGIGLPDIDLSGIGLPDIGLPSFGGDGEGFNLDGIIDGGKVVAEAVGNAEALSDKPNVNNAYEFIEATQAVSELAGMDSPIIPPPAAGALIDTAAVASIVDAFEDPEVGNLADAYNAIDHLVVNHTEIAPNGLPYGDVAGAVGQMVQGIDALKDGEIDNIGEAVSVAQAANVAYQVGSAVSTGSSVTAAAANAVTGAAAPAGSFAAAIPQVAAFAAAASLVPAVTTALKGGAAGNYPRIQGDFNVENGQFTSSQVMAGDTNRTVGDVFAKETADTATSMANDLINNYGFEIDYKALQAAPEVMRLQTSSHYAGEGRSQEGAAGGSSDFVAKLLQNGILKPTENTPTEILSSNDAFGNFLTDYFATNQDAYAARMYDKTDGTGEEMISMGGTKSNRTRNVTSRARFATEAAAQDWASNNLEEDYNMKSVRVGKAAQRKMPHKTTTSYEVVPIQVGDQTVYELKKSSSTVKVSQSEYDEATKPKPEPVAQSTPTYDPSDFLSNFNFNFGNFPVGPLF